MKISEDVRRTKSAQNVHHGIPKALYSAFDQPDKSKKPFSYFASGQLPDLSSKPSPKSVRRANPLSYHLPMPKVLPIVSESDLSDCSRNWGRMENARKPVCDIAATLTNSNKYNTPVGLFCKYKLNGELNTPRRFMNSPAHLEPEAGGHSKSSGHLINPANQSPCFKRLQCASYQYTDSEDEAVVEVKPSDVHTMENGYNKVINSNETAPDLKKNGACNGQQFKLLQKSLLASHVFNENDDALKKEQEREGKSNQEQIFHESNGTEIRDPALLAKILEAERPKVPASVVPEWTRQAALKHEKWRGYAEYQANHNLPQRYQGPTVSPAQLFSPVPWHSRNISYNGSATLPRSYQSRGISREAGKESWMKTAAGPNSVESKFSTPLTVRTSSSTPPNKVYSSTNSMGKANYLHEYSSTDNTNHQTKADPTNLMTASWSVPKNQESLVTGPPSVAPRSNMETSYFRPVTTSKLEHSISRQLNAPWTPAGWTSNGSQKAATADADQSSQTIFQHENEAQEKMRQLEKEMATRRATETPKSATGSEWKYNSPGGNDTVGGEQQPVAITQQWKDAYGATTKSQTSGSYVDNDGNIVHYVKEVYTSSDPGKEFSMLSQQERKVLEELVEPGVITRHTTTKYYKKSTYTSSATSATPNVNTRPSTTTPVLSSASAPQRAPYKPPVMETTY